MVTGLWYLGFWSVLAGGWSPCLSTEFGFFHILHHLNSKHDVCLTSLLSAKIGYQGSFEFRFPLLTKSHRHHHHHSHSAPRSFSTLWSCPHWLRWCECWSPSLCLLCAFSIAPPSNSGFPSGPYSTPPKDSSSLRWTCCSQCWPYPQAAFDSIHENRLKKHGTVVSVKPNESYLHFCFVFKDFNFQ